MIDSPYLVEPGSKVRLERIKTDDTGDFRDRLLTIDAPQPNRVGSGCECGRRHGRQYVQDCCSQ